MAEVEAMRFVHPNCWAASLGGCDDKISREHVVSQGLFESDQIAVQGFSWCRNEPKTIGLSALVAKILCRTHNSGLSVLDDAALHAFNVFREVIRTNQVRGKLKHSSWTVKRFKVNGPLLERWFLKTLINLSFSGEWAIGLGSHKKGTPSQRLVRIAFGHEAFEPYEGLYIAGYPGENIDSMDRVSFTPMTERDNLVVGRFNFRGYRFYLSLVPEKVENFEGSPLLYRDSTLRFMVQDRLSHIVRLRWQ